MAEHETTTQRQTNQGPTNQGPAATASTRVATTTPQAPTDGEAGDVRQRARQKATDAKEKTKEKARELEQEARSRLGEAADQAERQADEWTTSFGRRAESLADALHAASDRLRQDGEDAMADMAGSAADQVGRVSGYLEDEDPSAMLHDLEDTGRSNPAAFLGAAFTLGLVGGRFLRSSSPSENGASGDGATRPASPVSGAREGTP